MWGPQMGQWIPLYSPVSLGELISCTVQDLEVAYVVRDDWSSASVVGYELRLTALMIPIYAYMVDVCRCIIYSYA
jgi:hypothetical protein